MNKSTNLLTLYDRKQDRSNSDQYSHFVCSSDEKDWVFLQKKVSYILLVETKITLISYQPGDGSP